MKKLLYVILLFLIFFASPVKAQNYNPLVSGNTSVFHASFGDGHIRALHVDSTSIDNGKESFYFLKSISFDGNCYSNDYVADWTGPKMLKDGDAYFFFNKDNDSIKILPLKEVGEAWKLYKYTDGSYIEASVTAKELVSILTISDSVKTISLQLKDALGNAVSNTINGKTIQVSKNHGLTALIDFINIPDFNNIETLVGLSAPAVGLQLLTPRKIYNFDIGDEFHYEEKYTNTGISTTDDIKRVLHVTGKYVSSNTDTVKYTINDYSETTTHHYFPTTPDTYSNTSTVYTNTYVFNDSTIYPVSRKFDEEVRVIKSFSPNGVDDNGRSIERISSTFVAPNGDGCSGEILDYGSDELTLLEGVGKLQHNWSAGFASNYEYLVYYKKGSQTWGTPLALSSTKKVNSSFSLFPNPLKQGEQLKLQTENFQICQIVIINNLGTKVLDAFSPNATVESIDVSMLPSGIYVIQLLNNNNEFISSKFIIK